MLWVVTDDAWKSMTRRAKLRIFWSLMRIITVMTKQNDCNRNDHQSQKHEKTKTVVTKVISWMMTTKMAKRQYDKDEKDDKDGREDKKYNANNGKTNGRECKGSKR